MPEMLCKSVIFMPNSFLHKITRLVILVTILKINYGIDISNVTTCFLLHIDVKRVKLLYERWEKK